MAAAAPEAITLDREKLGAARLFACNAKCQGAQPYLASALFSLIVVPCPGLGTFGVDKYWRLYVDPVLVDEWEVPTIAAVLVHEVWHLLRQHSPRSEAVGAYAGQHRWNVAADAEINDDLVDTLPLPEWVVTPAKMGMPGGLLAEEYYAALGKKDGGLAPGPDCGSGAGGPMRPWELPENDGAGSLSAAKGDMVRIGTAKDILAHKSQGRLPAGHSRWAEEILCPVVDWRRLLAGAVRSAFSYIAGQVDYSRRRPSRRGIPAGVLLPVMHRPVPEVAVVVDTSGSMGAGELARCLAEVDGVLSGAGCARVPVLCVDAAVASVKRVSHGRDITLLGGGGTDMREGIEAARRLRPRPEIIVVLTDGYTPWPESRPARTRVVVGVIGDPATTSGWPIPEWATRVDIAPAALRA